MKTILEVPRLNANDDEAQVIFWYVDDRAEVEAGQDIVDLETLKAAVTIKSETAGFIRLLRVLRDKVKVGDPYAVIYSTCEELEADCVQDTKAPASEAQSGVRFTKRARELLQQHGLSVEAFSGSGMVTAEMVQCRLAEGSGQTSAERRRESLGVAN